MVSLPLTNVPSSFYFSRLQELESASQTAREEYEKELAAAKQSSKTEFDALRTAHQQQTAELAADHKVTKNKYMKNTL